MWSYSQATGILRDARGNEAGRGYSGHGTGVNNPAMQQDADVGPLPQGLYSLGAPVDDPKLGPFAIPLAPHSGNEMFGRGGFFVHGDEVGHVGQELASHGCIVLDRPTRERLWRGDHVLEVTA